MAVKITADSVKAAKLKEALNKDGESTRVIGFALPNPIEEEEEEYEDDE